MNVEALEDLDIASAAALLRAGDISSVDLVMACAARIAEYAEPLNCFVQLQADEALRQAAAADRERARGVDRGPLHGIPLAEKDMFFTPGKTSSMGSALGRRFAPTTRATILDKLSEAGAVSLGTLHMTEFAAGPTGQNEFLGSCRNPWNTDYISGGSSSGSACAVAARFVPGSIGSDTGGSIRLPAAMCGVVGLKPTYGVVSRHGAMPRCWSLDVIGPIARTALDCAILLNAIAGVDPEDSATCHGFPAVDLQQLGGDGRIRVGLADLGPDVDVDPDVRQAIRQAASVLEQNGCVLEEVTIPSTRDIYALTQVVNKAEAAALHAGLMLESGEHYGLSARSRIEVGFHIPAPYYLAAIAARPRVLRRFAADVFSTVDAVLLPTITTRVPSIAEVSMTQSADVPRIVDRVTQCTRWVSYLGLPAIAAPCGRSADGLPIGLQILGRPYGEQTLLALVARFQSATRWHLESPPLVSSRRDH